LSIPSGIAILLPKGIAIPRNMTLPNKGIVIPME